MKKSIGIIASVILIFSLLFCVSVHSLSSALSIYQGETTTKSEATTLPKPLISEHTENNDEENTTVVATESVVEISKDVIVSNPESTEKIGEQESVTGSGSTEETSKKEDVFEPVSSEKISEESSAASVDAASEKKPDYKIIAIIGGILAAVTAAVIVFIKTRTGSSQPIEVQDDPGTNKKTDLSTTEEDLPIYMTSVSFKPDKSAPVNVVRVHNVGRRKNQEDSFGVSNIKDDELCRKRGVMAVVADGMGGLKGGEDVSSLAVLTMLQGFSDMSGSDAGEQILSRLLQMTVSRVNQQLERTVGLKKAGSTLMSVIIHNRRLSWISVGDSRTALYRGGRLTDLNHKHIYAAELDEMVKQGRITEQQAKSHPDREKLTSYIGMGELKYVDSSVRPMQLNPGDKIILMSDGVFNTLTDSEIEQILNLPIDLIGEQLENAVLRKNNPHQDNFTAVILEIPVN